MKRVDSVISLIYSLSKSEKKHFSLQVIKDKEEKDYLVIYDIIIKSKQPNGNTVKEEFYRRKPNGSFEVSIQYLYEKLTDTLLTLRKKKDIYYDLLNNLCKARMLYERSLFEECFEILSNTIEQAQFYENNEILTIALKLELEYLLRLNFPNMTEQELFHKHFIQNEALKNIFNILVLVLYGFSIGAVNSVTYVRMYMLLTVWCLFFLLENIQIYKEEKITVKRFVLLCIATFGGLYTHFFFIIFACPIVGLMLTKVIRERNLGWKVFLKYSIAGGIGIICAFGTFPTYLRKLSGKDGNANSSLTHTNMRNFSDWGERIKIYWKDISSELFGSLWSVILILFLVLLVGYRVCNILYKIKIEKKEKKIQLIIEKKPISGKKIIEIKQSYIIAIGILLVIVFYFLLCIFLKV